MKSGGRCLVLSILCVVLTLATALGPINRVSLAAPDNDTVTEEVDSDTGSDSETDESTDESEDTQVEDETEETCESGLLGLGWLICPGQNLVTSALSLFFNLISSALQWTMLSENTESIREVWQDFLNIANIAFAIAFLLMIYSMATSTGLSNYDVKKLLPRLVVVAVAVNLSLYICAAMVDLSNIAGQGIYDILTSQMDGAGFENLSVNLVASVIGAAAAAIAIVTIGGAALIALLIILLAIVVRQVALVILVVISPIAFTLYILPNTEKWGKQWLNAFSKMLLVYPMFMTVWGGSQLVSNIVSNTSDNVTITSFITNFVCSIAPAVAILPLFKSAGNIMGTATKAIAGHAITKNAKTALQGSINRSRPVTTGRRYVGNTALKAQNKLGDARFVGGLVRGPAINKLVNTERDFVTAQNKKAMEFANNWVSTLNGKQLNSLVRTGSYKDDKGKTITVGDTYKLEAAIVASKNKMISTEWKDAMRTVNDRAFYLKNHGRDVEANRLLSTFGETAIASKSMTIGPGAISSFASGGWDLAHFDAEYGNATSKYVSAVSPTKLSNLTSTDMVGIRESMLESISDSATRGLTSDKLRSIQNNYEQGVIDLRDTSQLVKNSSTLIDGISTKSRKEIDFNISKTRSLSQISLAKSLKIDDLFAKYSRQRKDYFQAISSRDSSSISRLEAELTNSASEARRIILSGDHRSLPQTDKDNLQKIMTYTVGSNPDELD